MIKAALKKVFGIDVPHPLEKKSEPPLYPIESVIEENLSSIGLREDEYFTQRSRQILRAAQGHAERLQHASVRTEHLLLGFLDDKESVAGVALRLLEPQPDIIQQVIIEMSAKSDLPSETIIISPDLKGALELAVNEARRSGKPYIGTEHLLLALTHQEDTLAVQVLNRLGLTPKIIQAQIKAILKSAPKK